MNTPATHLHSSRAPQRVLLLAAMVAALALLAGCTNARLTNVWRDPDYHGGSLQGVLVVGREGDQARRRLTEDEVAEQLRHAGVNATCAYTLFADAAPTQSEMTSTMRERDLDGALVIKPLKATTQTEYVPGWRSVEPRGYYDPWRERSVIVMRGRYHAGYHVTDHIQRMQLTLWAGESSVRMVWAGTLEDENPGSADALRHDLAIGLVPGLRAAGFLGAAKHPS